MTPSCEMEMVRELVKRVREDKSHPIMVLPDATGDEFGELLRRLKQTESGPREHRRTPEEASWLP